MALDLETDHERAIEPERKRQDIGTAEEEEDGQDFSCLWFCNLPAVEKYMYGS